MLDLGFYDFWLFDRIDNNDGWFVSRDKDDANFEIVEELRTWRGNSIPLEGELLQDVLDDLQRREIDVRITLSFERKRGSCASTTRTFRLVGLRNEEAEEYHLYLTNLGREKYRAPDIAPLYRARWEVELLFKELKSRFSLDEINTTDAYIIEALIIVAAISLLMSRVIVDELRKLNAKQREVEVAADADESASRLPRRRCSLAVERHAHLIQLYLMLELSYELPDLDELLLWASRNPNPHRERLYRQVESCEFAFDRHETRTGGCSGSGESSFAVIGEGIRSGRPGRTGRQEHINPLFRDSIAPDIRRIRTRYRCRPESVS